MNFKYLGIILIVIGMASLVVFWQFTTRLNEELHKQCPLPLESCPFKTSMPVESYFGFSLSGVIILIGMLLFLQKPVAVEERKKDWNKILNGLESDEKNVYAAIKDAGGLIFQNELVEKTGYSKVKVSRILDKLEVKGFVERRRRGMSNIVVLK